jgi:hypothetical protein
MRSNSAGEVRLIPGVSVAITVWIVHQYQIAESLNILEIDRQLRRCPHVFFSLCDSVSPVQI